VKMKPRGIAISCGQIAAPGVRAREAKSGALVMSVNMLLKQLEMDRSICQCSADPDSLLGCEKTGPVPPARESVHPKSASPTAGPTTALAMKSHLSLWIGTQIVGREMHQ